MTSNQKLTRAAARVVKFGAEWDRRNGFNVVLVAPIAPTVPTATRVHKPGITAMLKAEAGSVLRRSQPVPIIRCQPANGNFAKWLERRAA